MKQAMKESAPFQHEGIMSISKILSGNIDTKIKRMVESAKRQGVDLDNLSEQELKYMLEIIKEDNSNLKKYGDWHKEMSPLIHKRTRLLSRYV